MRKPKFCTVFTPADDKSMMLAVAWDPLSMGGNTIERHLRFFRDKAAPTVRVLTFYSSLGLRGWGGRERANPVLPRYQELLREYGRDTPKFLRQYLPTLDITLLRQEHVAFVKKFVPPAGKKETTDEDTEGDTTGSGAESEGEEDE